MITRGPRPGSLAGACVTLMFTLGAAQGLRAEHLPVRGKVDSRIRTALYNPQQVYRLHAFVGYQIELIFESGEHFTGQGGGDLEGIAFGAHENHLILKPRADQVGTNLVIYTNRRAYRFEYTVHSHAPDPLADEVMYAVRFIYPPQPTAEDPVRLAAQRLEAELARAAALRPRNHDYWFCGDEGVKPAAAFDDGVHTRLTFGVRSELPAVFVLNEDGSESLLNFSVHDGDVVIHRVARRLIVRRGGLTGCIVNQGFRGGGERLESGTLAPAIVRQRKGRWP